MASFDRRSSIAWRRWHFQSPRIHQQGWYFVVAAPCEAQCCRPLSEKSCLVLLRMPNGRTDATLADAEIEYRNRAGPKLLVAISSGHLVPSTSFPGARARQCLESGFAEDRRRARQKQINALPLKRRQRPVPGHRAWRCRWG